MQSEPQKKVEQATFILERVESLGITISPASRLMQMLRILEGGHIEYSDLRFPVALEAIRDMYQLRLIVDEMDAHRNDLRFVANVKKLLQDAATPQDGNSNTPGTQQGRKEIEAHQIQLGRQLARDHGEIRQLALDERPGGQVSHRIADIQERIEKAELELAKVNRQLVDLEKHEMSTQEIEDALIDFDRVWDALTTREQSQLLALLVSKVEFDQSDCTIAITFHASGIETLEQQSQEV